MIRTASITTLFTVALAAGGQAQATWYVDASNTPPGTGSQLDPYASLQDAIAQPATLSGDTLLVQPGTYFEQIDFLGKALLVQGTGGPAATILDGNGDGPVVTFATGETAGSVLDGFTVQNGDSRDGDPSLDLGGGIHCDGASPTLVNLVVRANQSHRGGGLGLVNGSAPTLTDSVVRENNHLISHSTVGSSQGGGMWSSCDSAPVVLRCDFIDNDRSSGGGAFGSGTFTECLFDGNNGYEGAGLYVPDTCTTVVHDSTFRNGNTCVDGDCGRGGGVLGPAQLFDCLLEHNFAHDQGGGAWGATLTRCTLRDNWVTPAGIGSAGGGAAASTLVECVVEANRAYGSNPLFAASVGGGLAGCVATDCIVRENEAIEGRGAGAYGSTLLRCEVYDNVASSAGPGDLTVGGGVANCTSTYTLIRDNQAASGAGISNGTSVNCTVYGNVSSTGTGGAVDAGLPPPGASGSAILRNTIVRATTGVSIVETNGTVSATYCDIEGGFAGVGNFDADPLWWDAPSGDFHLRPGSPCIDSGDPSELDLDGSRRDVGALPYDPSWAPGTQAFCFGNATDCPCGNGGSGDGGCDLPQATGGVVLAIDVFAPDFAGGGSAQLQGSGYPPLSSPTAILIRSPSAASPPVVFGDGLRCISTAGLVRLGAAVASGGASQHVTNHGAGAGTFVYQVWFRSTPSTFCDPLAAFNLSNGLAIPWP